MTTPWHHAMYLAELAGYEVVVTPLDVNIERRQCVAMFHNGRLIRTAYASDDYETNPAAVCELVAMIESANKEVL
jgi:hypothetical protein